MATCAVLPVSWQNCASFVSLLNYSNAPRSGGSGGLGEMMIVGLAASRWTWLSLPGVIGLCARGPSTPQVVVSLGMCLTGIFFWT